MPLDVFSIFVIAAITILLGYVGNAIFNKTRVPDVLWLLLFGLAIGPILGIIDVGIFTAISPFLSTIALLFVLFDAGLNMNFYQLIHQFPRSVFMAVANMVILIFAVGFIMHVLAGNFLLGALLGAIVSDTSSISILSMIRNLDIKSKSRTFLVVESVVTDPFVIIVAITIIEMISLGTFGNPVKGVISSFSIGAMIGIVAGIAWLTVMDRLKGKPFDYILTLSILLLLYVFVETSGGSGAVSSLLFGLVLGNGGVFSRFLRLSKRYTVDNMVKSMQTEISFFISSFFFVFLGMIVSIVFSSFILGIAVAAVAIIARIVTSKAVLHNYDVPHFDRNIIMHIAPKGLAAAIMAEIAVSSGLAGTENFIAIVFTVILATTIYASIAERFIIGRRNNGQMASEKPAKARPSLH
ncbi:MAG: cation:proton antiporter [Candidatus Aenigmarchaeota archaeon]|nr:cation:proton antiporter [Candidatus Aenigmarchaeota archaeon]